MNHWSVNERVNVLDCAIFVWIFCPTLLGSSVLNPKSILLLREGLSQIIWILWSTELIEHSNFSLKTEEGMAGKCKLDFHFVDFSGLTTIHSYFLKIIWNTISSKHFDKHCVGCSVISGKVFSCLTLQRSSDHARICLVFL